MTEVDFNGKKRFFKKFEDILKETNFNMFLIKINIWSRPYFSEIWMDHPPCVRKLFMHSLSMNSDGGSFPDSANYELIASLSTRDIENGILFGGESLDLKMFLVECCASMLRFQINDMEIDLITKGEIGKQVDCLTDYCCQKNMLSKQLDDVTREDELGELQEKILKTWIDIVERIRNMVDLCRNRNDSIPFMPLFIFSRNMLLLFNGHQKKSIRYFYNRYLKETLAEIKLETFGIAFYLCDAFLKTYIHLKNTPIPINTQFILLEQIINKVRIHFHCVKKFVPIQLVNDWKNYCISWLKCWKDFCDLSGILENTSVWGSLAACQKVIFLCCFPVQKNSEFLIGMYKECAQDMMRPLSLK